MIVGIKIVITLEMIATIVRTRVRFKQNFNACLIHLLVLGQMECREQEARGLPPAVSGQPERSCSQPFSISPNYDQRSRVYLIFAS